MFTANQLEDHLSRAGWRFEKVDEHTWASGFQGRTATFPFFIRLTDDWIFFTIVPFIKAPEGEKALFPLYRRVLELNRMINLAKFALDEEGDLLLTVELPTEQLGPSGLDDALTALRYYADAHYVELRDLAG